VGHTRREQVRTTRRPGRSSARRRLRRSSLQRRKRRRRRRRRRRDSIYRLCVGPPVMSLPGSTGPPGRPDHPRSGRIGTGGGAVRDAAATERRRQRVACERLPVGRLVRPIGPPTHAIKPTSARQTTLAGGPTRDSRRTDAGTDSWTSSVPALVGQSVGRSTNCYPRTQSFRLSDRQRRFSPRTGPPCDDFAFTAIAPTDFSVSGRARARAHVTHKKIEFTFKNKNKNEAAAYSRARQSRDATGGRVRGRKVSPRSRLLEIRHVQRCVACRE
jgi:hypothetical protein